MKRNEYIDPENLNFHYKREDRLKTLDPSVKNEGKPGFFKKNRQLKIILLDILIIVLASIILPPLLKSRSYKNNVYGCNIRFECFMLSESVLATLIFEDRKEDPDRPDNVDIVFTVKDTDFEYTMTEPVIFSPTNSKTYIRTELDLPGEASTVFAEINFGEKKFKLQSGIKGK